MDLEAITKRVIELTAEESKVSVDDITLGSNFVDDLGMDSLDLVELAMIFEEEFCIHIPTARSDECDTVKKAVELVIEMLRESFDE